mgnify:CR=1 FL=1
MERKIFNKLRRVFYKNGLLHSKKDFKSTSLRKTDRKDRRLHPRIKFNIKIAVKNIKESVFAEAKSVDISFNGIGVKFSPAFRNIIEKDSILELWLYLPDKLKPIHRCGKIVWYKKKNYFFCRGGIQFK